MRQLESKVALLAQQNRLDEFAAVLEHTFPHVGRRTQLMAEYAVVCLFWGFILYLGASLTLH